MRKIGFVVDSTSGIKYKDVSVVPLKINIDGVEYEDGKIEQHIVVKALKDKVSIKTSQPPPTLFMLAYDEQLKKGYEHVICLTISGTLSGTVNSANLGKEMLESNQVTVIDSQTGDVGVQYILEKALKLANTGAEVDEVIDYIEKLITKGSLLFTVDNLSTLVKNGRLTKVQALIGNVLRIKPILRFKQGVLNVEHKARGLQGVFKYINRQIVDLLEHLNIVVRIAYIDNLENAEKLYSIIKNLNKDNIDVELRGTISPVISAHIGIGGMGIYLAHK